MNLSALLLILEVLLQGVQGEWVSKGGCIVVLSALVTSNSLKQLSVELSSCLCKLTFSEGLSG
jgi:hypothetical protein